jgi:hypothetical protein
MAEKSEIYEFRLEREGVLGKVILKQGTLQEGAAYIDRLEETGKFPEGFDVVAIQDGQEKFYYTGSPRGKFGWEE